MKKLMILFLFIFIVSFAFAQPPFTQESDPSVGLQLETGIPSTHLLGEDYYLHAHVYNATTGLLVTSGINCYYHAYNHQINGGEHISIGNLSQNGDGYQNYLDGSLLNETGQYSVLIWCNSTTEGGFLQYRFEITPTGTDEISIGFVVILMLASLMFGLFAWMFNRDMFLHILFVFGSMLVLLYGINQLHIPMLFFTAVVIVLLAFVYYIINYIRDTLGVFRKNKGWE